MNTNPQQFIETMTPAALGMNQKYGLPAGMLVAEAALESGWGTNTLSTQFNNPWAVKYPTDRSIPRKLLPGNDLFANYSSLDQAAEDYARFVNPANNSRYAAAWSKRSDPVAFIQELSKAGYEDGVKKDAPGPYANNIIGIYQQYHLDKLDQAPAAPPAPVPNPAPAAPPPPAGGYQQAGPVLQLPGGLVLPAPGNPMDWLPGVAVVLILLAMALLTMNSVTEG